MNLNLVSRYRNAIMGIGILWIVFHHSGIDCQGLLFAIKRTGYAGVDIFLALSGFGCAYSLSKNENASAFFMRRLNKLYPHYIPMLIAFLIIGWNSSNALTAFTDIFGNLTGFSFWAKVGRRFNWYIQAIILFYALTPLLYSIVKHHGISGLVLSVAVFFICGLCFLKDDELTIAVSRFPIYIVGLFCGYHGYKQTKTARNSLYTILIITLGIAGVFILYYIYYNKDSLPVYNVFYPCLLITPAIVFMLCSVFGVIEKYRFGERIIAVLSLVGEYSLDIYLFHIVFFKYFGLLLEGKYESELPHTASVINTVLWVLIIAISVVLSIGYGKCVSKIESFFGKKEKSQRHIL